MATTTSPGALLERLGLAAVHSGAGHARLLDARALSLADPASSAVATASAAAGAKRGRARKRVTPATAAVEEVAGAWVTDLLGLPADSAVGFVLL